LTPSDSDPGSAFPPSPPAIAVTVFLLAGTPVVVDKFTQVYDKLSNGN